MRKVTLSFQQPQIEINGVVYDVLRSDAAIVQDMIDIDARFADRGDAPDTVLEKNAAMLEYLDTLFGAGAAQRIRRSIPDMEGYDLGLGGMNTLLSGIVGAASQVYAEAIKLQYDD